MRHRRTAAAIGAAAIVGSCGVKEDNWVQRHSEAFCDYAKRCDRADFYYAWEDEGSCRSAKEAEWAEVQLTVCVFDQKMARECMDAYKSSCKKVGREYDDLVAPCNLVWDCGTEESDTSDSGIQPL